MSIRAAQHSNQEAASFQKIDKAIEVIRKQLEGFETLKTSGETIQNSAVKMLERVRIMKTELDRQVEVLAEQVGGLKDSSETGTLL